MFFLDPKKRKYVRLDNVLHEEIVSGAISL